MSSATDLRTVALADGTVAGLIGSRMYHGNIPEQVALPYVWIARRATEDYGQATAETRPFREYFDVECVSSDVSQAEDVADAMRAALNGQSGSLGDGTYGGVLVRDQAEDYVPRNQDADEHLHIQSLDVEVINPR